MGDLSDEAMAERMRADQIDILVDLKGPTYGNAITFSTRASADPDFLAQLSSSTRRNTDVDYVIGDKFVLPDTSKPHYHEKVHPPAGRFTSRTILSTTADAQLRGAMANSDCPTTSSYLPRSTPAQDHARNGRCLVQRRYAGRRTACCG